MYVCFKSLKFSYIFPVKDLSNTLNGAMNDYMLDEIMPLVGSNQDADYAIYDIVALSNEVT